jgi:hypothetical protein
MILSINQPAYFPWLGYFERIASSDVHIILDHVQFEKNSMTNRNKVKTSQGWAWLTVPVCSKGEFGDLSISSLKISQNKKWKKKHWNTIRAAYSKTPFFNEHSEFFEEIYSKEWDKLEPLMNEITNYLLDALSISTKIIRSSELDPKESKSELILELCKKAGATTYLSGPFGRDYLDLIQFQEHGIDLQFQDYQHPTYKQMHGEFLPYMSTIDLLFNEGSKSLDILTGGQEK